MAYQIVLVPNHDLRAFLLPIPALLNGVQSAFKFSVREKRPTSLEPSIIEESADVDQALIHSHKLKTEFHLSDEDLLIHFIGAPLEYKLKGLSNLFLACSSLSETPPRVATVSSSFIHRHILPVDPAYLIQRHACYHLIVCCLAGSFLEMGPHEDRGCLLDFNSYTPNINLKIRAGYLFCESCTRIVERNPLGDALFKICDAFKLGAETITWPEVQELGKKPKVFLCYAGSDRERVNEIYERLSKDGFDPWMDKKKLVGGQDWRLEIKRAIKSSDYFVACISSCFQNPTFGHTEIKHALEVLDTMPEGKIYLIPVRLEECVIEERLAGRQWVDLFEPDGYEKLINALRWNETISA
jgi:hypothetical protein